jgi:flagellar protein FlgJ
MTKQEFCKAYAGMALTTENKYRIAATFTLAQAALESGWGAHAPGLNFFGIKASAATPAQDKQLLRTTEVFADAKQGGRFPQVISITKRDDGKYLYTVMDWFRKYATAEESFNDHAQFFFDNKRYAAALEVRDDAREFAKAIAKAGYATATNYAQTLIQMIDSIEIICKSEALFEVPVIDRPCDPKDSLVEWVENEPQPEPDWFQLKVIESEET